MDSINVESLKTAEGVNQVMQNTSRLTSVPGSHTQSAGWVWNLGLNSLAVKSLLKCQLVNNFRNTLLKRPQINGVVVTQRQKLTLR